MDHAYGGNLIDVRPVLKASAWSDSLNVSIVH